MKVSRNYAKAYYLAMKEEKGKSFDSGAFERELVQFVETCKNSADLSRILFSPVFTEIEKGKVLSEIFKRTNASDSLVRFIQLLLKNERLEVLETITSKWSEVRQEEELFLKGTIFSAESISEEQRTEFQKTFTKILTLPVMLEEKHEPELIAGFRVEIAGTVYDASLKAQLERMKKNLIDGKNLSIH